MPGDVVAGKLVVEKVLGSGGMGLVVAARHRELGERVAIKVLRAPGDARAMERMRREARASAKLRGEHIVRVMDVGALEDGSPYIVMEYVAGRTLASEREARQRVPLATAVDWVLQACEGLAEAHSAGIVHRDIKPSNLLLTTRLDGAPLVKVLDFGIAKSAAVMSGTLTETGGFIGSPLYASPEQVRDARLVDARTDIWSLGVVLYELVTGRLPFPSFTASGALASLVADPPVPPRSVAPELPEAFENILLRCLEKPLDARFSDVAALAHALEPFGSEAAGGTASRIERVLRAEGRAPRSVPPLALASSESTVASHAEPAPADRTATEMQISSSGTPPLRASRLHRRSWLVPAALLLALGGVGWLQMRARGAPAGHTVSTNPSVEVPVVASLAGTPVVVATASASAAPVRAESAPEAPAPRALRVTAVPAASSRSARSVAKSAAVDVDFGPRK